MREPSRVLKLSWRIYCVRVLFATEVCGRGASKYVEIITLTIIFFSQIKKAFYSRAGLCNHYICSLHISRRCPPWICIYHHTFFIWTYVLRPKLLSNRTDEALQSPLRYFLFSHKYFCIRKKGKLIKKLCDIPLSAQQYWMDSHAVLFHSAWVVSQWNSNDSSPAALNCHMSTYLSSSHPTCYPLRSHYHVHSILRAGSDVTTVDCLFKTRTKIVQCFANLLVVLNCLCHNLYLQKEA
jgi:hypothetical protein